MERADVQKFVAGNHRGVLVARKRDGAPHITLVTPGIDAQGHVIVTSRGTTDKAQNIRRDARVSMLVMGEQFSGSKYLQLKGKAEIIEQPEAMDLLIYWYRQVREEHKNWDEYRETMKKEQRVIFPDPYREGWSQATRLRRHPHTAVEWSWQIPAPVTGRLQSRAPAAEPTRHANKNRILSLNLSQHYAASEAGFGHAAAPGIPCLALLERSRSG